MSGGILELMGATAGALALVDRLTENPKRRGVKKNPSKIRGTVMQDGDVYAHWIDPVTRELRSKQFTVAPQAVRHAKQMHKLGFANAHATLFGRGIARVIWDSEDIEMKDNPRGRGRSKGGVKRPSQVTRKKPTKRLIKRRMITARSPKGVFANPTARGYDVAANGATIATFRTLAHAKEYGQAFADAHKTAVRIRKP